MRYKVSCLEVIAADPNQLRIDIEDKRWSVRIESTGNGMPMNGRIVGLYSTPQEAQKEAVRWSQQGYVAVVQPYVKPW